MSEENTRWKMCSELAGFNPVKLELRKAVRFPSDELVDVAVVKRFPQILFLASERFFYSPNHRLICLNWIRVIWNLIRIIFTRFVIFN